MQHHIVKLHVSWGNLGEDLYKKFVRSWPRNSPRTLTWVGESRSRYMTTTKMHAEFAKRLGSPKAWVEFWSDWGQNSVSWHCPGRDDQRAVSVWGCQRDASFPMDCRGAVQRLHYLGGSWFAKYKLSIRHILDFMGAQGRMRILFRVCEWVWQGISLWLGGFGKESGNVLSYF